MNLYETDRYLSEYLLFHFAEPQQILPWADGPQASLGFTRRTVQAGLRHLVEGEKHGKALDLGCAVGGSAFVLAETFSEVWGIDYSHRFIEAANTLAGGGALAFERFDEGGLTTSLMVGPLPFNGLDKLRFEQGDAMNLRPDLGAFDFVHAANLLCRLKEPMRLIQRLPSLVRPGGLLVLATPCSWLEEYTPKDHWLGGRVEHGIPTRTVERLRHLLAPSFVEVECRDEPFLIREHERKYQWSVSAVTVWRRR